MCLRALRSSTNLLCSPNSITRGLQKARLTAATQCAAQARLPPANFEEGRGYVYISNHTARRLDIAVTLYPRLTTPGGGCGPVEGTFIHTLMHQPIDGIGPLHGKQVTVTKF